MAVAGGSLQDEGPIGETACWMNRRPNPGTSGSRSFSMGNGHVGLGPVSKERRILNEGKRHLGISSVQMQKKQGPRLSGPEPMEKCRVRHERKG